MSNLIDARLINILLSAFYFVENLVISQQSSIYYPKTWTNSMTKTTDEEK